MTDMGRWVALPVPDHEGRMDRVYGPFNSYDEAKACAARLSSDPDRCQAVAIEPPPQPVTMAERGAARGDAERLRELVLTAPGYLGARSALHNEWLRQAEAAVGRAIYDDHDLGS